MAKTVKVAVCCGGGIFTSTVVTEKVEAIAQQARIPVKVEQHKIMEVPSLQGVDLILTTMKTDVKNNAGAPVMMAMPLVSGIGADDFTEKLVEKLKEISDK